MAAKHLHAMLSYAALVVGVFALPATPAEAQENENEPQLSEKMKAGINESLARLRFAPMWIPVPKFPVDAEANAAEPIPAEAYATIWQTAWQKDLGVSSAQKKTLDALRDKALAKVKEHTDHFKSLTPEEQQKEVESWGGRSAPWQQQLEQDVATQIEALLTPAQLKTLNHDSYPQYAMAMVYDPGVRRQIGYSAEQEDKFRGVVRERLAKFQQVKLKHAEQVWNLLSQQQQTHLAGVVKRQGPTSAALSIAGDLGFDIDAMALSYPMLAQAPVRERLGLDAKQAKQLQAVMAEVAAQSRTFPPQAPQPDQHAEQKQRIEAILTPQQLALLQELDFRRAVVLALGYPEKRSEIGMIETQAADLKRIDRETHQQLYRIDREMLDKAQTIFTPAQQEHVKVEIKKRTGA